jgi:hypothetical protein
MKGMKGIALRAAFYIFRLSAICLPGFTRRTAKMRIPLPNGDELVPDAEFLERAGDVTPRTGSNWDKEGCPHTYIGGKKYRPLNEGLNWLASRIKRRNPRRGRQRVAGRAAASEKTATA